MLTPGRALAAARAAQMGLDAEDPAM